MPDVDDGAWNVVHCLITGESCDDRPDCRYVGHHVGTRTCGRQVKNLRPEWIQFDGIPMRHGFCSELWITDQFDLGTNLLYPHLPFPLRQKGNQRRQGLGPRRGAGK